MDQASGLSGDFGRHTDAGPHAEHTLLRVGIVLGSLLLFVLLLWGFYIEDSLYEKSQARQATLERDQNLAIALEQYAIRLIKTSEAVTQMVAQQYEEGARGAALDAALLSRARNNDIFSEVLAVSVAGKPIAASRPGTPMLQRLNMADVMTEHLPSAVHIGSPVAVPGSSGLHLPVSRLLRDGSGRIDGAVVVMVPVSKFVDVFQESRVRDDTLILLGREDGSVISLWHGKDLSRSGWPEHRTKFQKAVLSVLGRGNLSGEEGPQLVTSRRVAGYPLVAVVGTSEADALDVYQKRSDTYAVICAAVTLAIAAIAVVLVLGYRREMRMMAAVEKGRWRLREANADLEQRVSERTSELEYAKRDLEAFSYSVAHDIRAPLSAIDGFSRALSSLPVISGSNEPRMAHYLDRIRTNVRQMGDLTDGLLALATLSPHRLRSVRVDMSRLAREALEALRERDPGRAVDVEIAPDLRTIGDPALLRQVLDNLLGNAWKFTVAQEAAKIEVGRLLDDADGAFFVRDNGAGFDSRYASKLFRPFQRLHNQTEFPGTGIGLASVRRIIEMHGGRVWGEGEAGNGASFYFWLPDSEGGPAV